MPNTPPVSLLLPNRNNGWVLDLTLERLLQHTTYLDFELIVVDDGSTDDSRQILRSWRERRAFHSFTLIEREASGVVEALNAGLAAAGGELVVQLDGDATIETPGWLEQMVAFQQSDPRVGAVNPLVVLDDGLVHAAGINVVSELGLHDRSSRPLEPAGQRTFNTLVHRVGAEEGGEVVNRAAEVDAAIGVCMLYPKAAAEELGGYDAGFSPVWFDDVDLSLSFRRLGLKVFYLPDVQVVHRLGMRRERASGQPAAGGRARLRRAVGSVLPRRLRDSLVRLERRGTVHPPHELRRLRHHYDYWRQKWGFDLMNPDMAEVLERYADTEVCWAYDAARSAAGRDILVRWSTTSR